MAHMHRRNRPFRWLSEPIQLSIYSLSARLYRLRRSLQQENRQAKRIESEARLFEISERVGRAAAERRSGAGREKH